jgi:hypothetical protein
MASHIATRAAFYRSRAQHLTRQAMAEDREEHRQHLFDLAEAFERAAGELAPPPAEDREALPKTVNG